MINYINNIYHTILNMNVDEIITKNKLLEEENKKLQDELIQTKEHLKKYTAHSNMKKYYENHKEEINTKEINNCNVIIRTKTGSLSCAKITHITETHITLSYPLNSAIILLENSDLIFYISKNEVKLPCTNTNFTPFRFFQCFS